MLKQQEIYDLSWIMLWSRKNIATKPILFIKMVKDYSQ